MVNIKIRLIMFFFSVKDGENLYSQQKQELELVFTKFMLKLKKLGKITRSFRFGLNQIPYDYILEVMNRFKGLDLIDRVPEELWTEVCNIVQEVVTKEIEMPHRWSPYKSKSLMNLC